MSCPFSTGSEGKPATAQVATGGSGAKSSCPVSGRAENASACPVKRTGGLNFSIQIEGQEDISVTNIAFDTGLEWLVRTLYATNTIKSEKFSNAQIKDLCLRIGPFRRAFSLDFVFLNALSFDWNDKVELALIADLTPEDIAGSFDLGGASTPTDSKASNNMATCPFSESKGSTNIATCPVSGKSSQGDSDAHPSKDKPASECPFGFGSVNKSADFKSMCPVSTEGGIDLNIVIAGQDDIVLKNVPEFMNGEDILNLVISMNQVKAPLMCHTPAEELRLRPLYSWRRHSMFTPLSKLDPQKWEKGERVAIEFNSDKPVNKIHKQRGHHRQLEALSSGSFSQWSFLHFSLLFVGVVAIGFSVAASYWQIYL